VKVFITLANSLSLLRLIIAPIASWAVISGWWLTASFLLLLAILSDMIDGPIARKKDQESAIGGLLDHTCDALLVTFLLFSLSKTHEIPVLLPILVLLSFSQYVLDSKALSGKKLRTSLLGRFNGIAYFVLTSFCIFPEALKINLPNHYIIVCSWILIASTLISMSERLWKLLTK
tara:strand:- start:2795 stop:3319 length:525 start_codon:yes stop_codon:yes gene_type:complete